MNNKKMNLQKSITIPEIISLCETHGYSDVLNGLKQLYEKEKNVQQKQQQLEKIHYLELYIKAASFDGTESVHDDFPF